MMRRWIGMLSCVALIAAASADAATPGLELTHKTLRTAKGVTIEADAGRLRVPENRSRPNSRTITVGFLRLRSTSKAPRAPLFYLEGGPGSRAVTENPQRLDFWVPLLAIGDVVLIDQRGTNDSNLVWRWDGPPPMNYFVHVDSAARHIERMNRRAFAAFQSRGVDLAGYTTVESADDLDALRAALGIERMSLLGFSYGTHLAIACMRRHGDRLEDVVLLGTEGPNETYKLPWTMDEQFQKLALLAARDPRIAGKVPDLLALHDRVIARLERQPMMVPVPAPGGNDTLRIPIGPFGLRFIMRVDIGDATDLPVFPRLLWSIDQGDPSVLAWFVRKRAGGALGVHGMGEAMDEASGMTGGRRALIEEQMKTSRFADVVNFPWPHDRSQWPVPDLGDGYRAPLVSPVRTLLVSGELDFNTPPYQAEALRWGLSNATHIIVANAGHEQTFLQNDQAMPVIADFLAGRDVHDRKIGYPPLRFVPLEGSGGGMHPAAGK